MIAQKFDERTFGIFVIMKIRITLIFATKAENSSSYEFEEIMQKIPQPYNIQKGWLRNET